MFTRTTQLAFRALVLLGQHREEGPLRGSWIAGQLGASPSYLRKTLGLLTRAGILESVRGVRGGVRFARAPEEISLREVVEACEGIIVGAFCRHLGDDSAGVEVCGYHRAMRDVFEGMVAALSRWHVADLLQVPYARGALPGGARCVMSAQQNTVHLAMKGRA